MQDEEPSIEASFNLGRALGNAFGAVRVAFGPLWLGGMLLSMTDCGGGRVPTSLPIPPFGSDDDKSSLLSPFLPGPWPRVVSGFFMDAPGDELAAGAIAVIALVVVLGLVIAVGLFALNAWLSTGFVRLQVAILEHGGEALSPLFSGRDRLWEMMGYKLLALFSGTAVWLVCGWPGALLAYYGGVTDNTTLLILGIGLAVIVALPVAIWIGIGTYLGEHAVVLDGASPSQALRRSFALARGGRLLLFVFMFVCGLIEAAGSLGIILCCVGVFATVPLARAIAGFAKTESYLLLTRGFAPSEGWYLWQRIAARGAPAPPMQPPPATPGV